MAHSPTRKTAYHYLCLDGERFVNDKDYATALLIYEKALLDMPVGDQKALKGICRCYRKLALKALKKQDFKKVQKLLQTLIAIPRIKPLLTSKDYYVLAEAALENMDLPLAEQTLEQMLTLKPESQEGIQLLKRLKAEKLHQQMKGLY
jgi:tetratricopeptide (TPR) repeat protein